MPCSPYILLATELYGTVLHLHVPRFGLGACYLAYNHTMWHFTHISGALDSGPHVCWAKWFNVWATSQCPVTFPRAHSPRGLSGISQHWAEEGRTDLHITKPLEAQRCQVSRPSPKHLPSDQRRTGPSIFSFSLVLINDKKKLIEIRKAFSPEDASRHPSVIALGQGWFCFLDDNCLLLREENFH